MVLEVRGSRFSQAFSLKPVGSYAHRLVVDIYPAHQVDPILTLLQQIDKDKALTAQPGSGAADLPTNNIQKDADGMLARSRPGPDRRQASSKEQRQAETETGQESATSPLKAKPKTGDTDGNNRHRRGHGGEDPTKGRNGAYEKT